MNEPMIPACIIIGWVNGINAGILFLNIDKIFSWISFVITFIFFTLSVMVAYKD